MEQELLDLCKEEQMSDEEVVVSSFSEESRDSDLYPADNELDCLTQCEEVTNSSKEILKQGNSALWSI